MSYRPICDIWLLARGAGSSGKKDYYGAYPSGFLPRALDLVGNNNVCHLCSGTIKHGVTVDINPELEPDIVADARNTPFEADTFDAVLIDPPYSITDAQKYGTNYPTMKSLLEEACRIVKPGGKVGFLHLLVPRIPKGYMKKYKALIGIITGGNQRIRVFTVIEKEK